MSQRFRALAPDERGIPPAVARREGEVARDIGLEMRERAFSLPSVSTLRSDLLQSADDYLEIARLRGVPVPPAQLAASPRDDRA